MQLTVPPSVTQNFARAKSLLGRNEPVRALEAFISAINAFEAAQIVGRARAGVAFAVNAVLDAAKRPAAVLAGRPPLTMAEAARLTARMYGLRFTVPYDIVIASCGGSPKDICLYQAQKGLTTAVQCVRPGGRVLLLAECGQGIGDAEYLEYARSFPDAATLITAFESGTFRMGAHKAYLFARLSAKCELVLHSALAPETLASCTLLIMAGNTCEFTGS